MRSDTLPRVTLHHHDKPVAAHIALAATFWSRFLGLSGTPRLLQRAGLLIFPCNSIHMLGMRYAIEAVFISKEGQVLKISRTLRPWIGLCSCPRAQLTLEWQPGNAEAFGIRVGDILRWEIEHD